MGKRRLPYTPSSHIRNALRRLWLHCREAHEAMKRTGYCCEKCGIKKSQAKGKEVMVEIHHSVHQPDWERIFSVVREELLQTSDKLMPLCRSCHDEIHKEK